MKTRRQYDRTGGPDEFKKMAVELSLAKGSVKNTADELGITSRILTRWRNQHSPQQTVNPSARIGPSQEQKEIFRLKKEPVRRRA